MTTKIKITNEGSRPAKVYVGNDQVGSDRTLMPDESMEAYVHQYAHIEIREGRDVEDA